MTTTIFADLIGAFCEFYYKVASTQTLANKNLNTIRNYGFSTSSAINFGFEIHQPIDLNDLKIQFGVITYNDAFTFVSNPVVTNNIYFNDLPSSGINTVSYINRLLPVVINVSQNSNSIAAFSTAFLTNGYLIENTDYSKEQIIRQFEGAFASDETNSILLMFNFENVNIVGCNSNWNITNNSFYSADIINFTVNNGFGQFGSLTANKTFAGNNTNLIAKDITNAYQSAYAFVYRWKNDLDWNNNFSNWYTLNKDTLNPYLQRFLTDFFGL